MERAESPDLLDPHLYPDVEDAYSGTNFQAANVAEDAQHTTSAWDHGESVCNAVHDVEESTGIEQTTTAVQEKVDPFFYDTRPSGLSVAVDLLYKQGWREGKGLGSNGQGALEPLSIAARPKHLGLGCRVNRRTFSDTKSAPPPSQEARTQLFPIPLLPLSTSDAHFLDHHARQVVEDSLDRRWFLKVSKEGKMTKVIKLLASPFTVGIFYKTIFKSSNRTHCAFR